MFEEYGILTRGGRWDLLGRGKKRDIQKAWTTGAGVALRNCRLLRFGVE
jgi:hypothetical protein